MKKTVLNQAGVNDLQERIKKLQPTTQRLWGQMHVLEMLRHCNAVNQLILTGSQSHQKTLLKQKIAKVLFVRLPFKFPKNLKAPKVVQQSKENTTVESFTREKELYIQIIHQFPSHRFPSKMYHPAFGNLSPEEWGIAAWRHLDHHLRQFGI